MTIGGEKVVYRLSVYEPRPWNAGGNEYHFSGAIPAGTYDIIPQSAYAELAAERDSLRDELSRWVHMLADKCAELQAAESQLAELRGALEKIGRRAADHPDDDDADRKRNLYHISAIVKAALAAADGGGHG